MGSLSGLLKAMTIWLVTNCTCNRLSSCPWACTGPLKFGQTVGFCLSKISLIYYIYIFCQQQLDQFHLYSSTSVTASHNNEHKIRNNPTSCSRPTTTNRRSSYSVVVVVVVVVEVEVEVAVVVEVEEAERHHYASLSSPQLANCEPSPPRI